MSTVRIATVKSTGKRYIVQQLDFRGNTAHCWGELRTFDITAKGVIRKQVHEGSVAFPLEQVTIENDVVLSVKVLDALFEQSVKAHEALIAEGKMSIHKSRTRKA